MNDTRREFRQPVVLTVNGESRSVTIESRRTLLTVLREDLRLTGAKRGCNQGVCGACTVLVDGRAVRSCIALAVAMTGRDITTIEGLSKDGVLDDVQRAFLEHGAIQCGFCTPGMVLAAKSLLAENPTADVEAIRLGLGGNLCRCSGYVKVIDAVRSVAAR